MTKEDAFTSNGTENLMRWDGSASRFMEVWYATLNHRATGAGLWLRYTLTAPAKGSPYCELWGFYFDPFGVSSFGGRERFSIDRLGRFGRDDGAVVRLGDAWLAENRLVGRVAGNGRELAWSLDFEPAPRCYHHLPRALEGVLGIRASVVCSPNLAVAFTGSFSVDGRDFECERDPGCQSHRWGRRHPASWAWAHCSEFEGAEDTLFEGIAARSRVGPPLSFLYMRLEGRDAVLNGVTDAIRARSRFAAPSWTFEARGDRIMFKGIARCPAGRAVQVLYEDPDGGHRYCVNSEIADLAVDVYRRTGASWSFERSLDSAGAGHVEFGSLGPVSGVPLVAAAQ